MRIRCPFCGERSSSEFACFGDADVVRPAAGIPDEARAYYESTYLRDNPAGPHRELWYHAFGCRSWLQVTRDTRTHEILGVQSASEKSR